MTKSDENEGFRLIEALRNNVVQFSAAGTAHDLPFPEVDDLLDRLSADTDSAVCAASGGRR